MSPVVTIPIMLILLGLYVLWFVRVYPGWSVRELRRRDGLCEGCGFLPAGCACPTEQVFVFTPWDSMTDEERGEGDGD
jgi:hypothetical protein